MEAGISVVRQSWVWLFAVLVFFFNAALPAGLTISFLLLPVWIYLLHINNAPDRHLRLLIAGGLLVYAAFHFAGGAVGHYYLISTALLLSSVLFAFVVRIVVSSANVCFDDIMRGIVILNFVLAVASIPVLFMPMLKPLVWYLVPISENIAPIPRLKLFAQEAAHYSFLLALPAIYFFSRALFLKVSNPGLTLLMISVPLALSFSLGVLACLLITGVAIVLLYARIIFSDRHKRSTLILMTVIAAGLLVAAAIFYPDNPLFLRMENIWEGRDTSARGRTYESFILADKIIAKLSYLWGIGPGQLKLSGRTTIIQYYTYTHIPEVVRIPNACADTLVCYGYTGLFIRLALQLFLFVKTKVARDPFRLWLFLFLFLYQFTGSYINNPAEFMLWAVAFTSIAGVQLPGIDKDRRVAV